MTTDKYLQDAMDKLGKPDGTIVTTEPQYIQYELNVFSHNLAVDLIDSKKTKLKEITVKYEFEGEEFTKAVVFDY